VVLWCIHPGQRAKAWSLGATTAKNAQSKMMKKFCVRQKDRNKFTQGEKIEKTGARLKAPKYNLQGRKTFIYHKENRKIFLHRKLPPTHTHHFSNGRSDLVFLFFP